MSKKLTFAEFQTLLKQRTLTADMLTDYVEFDDDSAVPKLAFRHDALLDSPPSDYDIDQEIYRFEREQRRANLELHDVMLVDDRIRVVAEGDSWFNLPAVFRPPAIADQLSKRSHLRVNNIAYWGHTLAKMLAEKEYLAEIKSNTKFFIFSAGGNDIQNGLEDGSAIYEFDPDRPLGDYLTEDGLAILTGIRAGYMTLISEVRRAFPAVNIVTHAYDYPRPLVGNGKYIGRYLREKNVQDELMQHVIDPIIDQLNATIAQAVTDSGEALYLDCRGVTSRFTWRDDMHPAREGFRALADVFDGAIT